MDVGLISDFEIETPSGARFTFINVAIVNIEHSEDDLRSSRLLYLLHVSLNDGK